MLHLKLNTNKTVAVHSGREIDGAETPPSTTLLLSNAVAEFNFKTCSGQRSHLSFPRPMIHVPNLHYPLPPDE